MLEKSSGAICYTIVDHAINYLIILDNHDNYGFPKGHIEEGESEEEAAIREIKEETNADVTLDTHFKKQLYYVMPNGNEKCANYFVGKFDNNNIKAREGEIQKILLLPYKKAREILTFNDVKQIFDQAHEYILRNHQ